MLNPIIDNYINKTCFNCNGSIESLLDYIAETIVCPHCNSVNEYKDGKLKTTKNNVSFKLKSAKIAPVLKVGSEGHINKIRYKVTGWARKKEIGTSYYWDEYTLYNPSSGLAFLTRYNDHWTFILEQKNKPIIKRTNAFYDNNQYQLFSKYYSKIIEAEGEFPYTFSEQEDVEIIEYIHPPYLLSSEKINNTTTWYKGEYIYSEDIKNGFQLKSITPSYGIGQIQPFPKLNNTKLILFLTFLAVFWMVLQTIFYITCHNEVVLSQNITVNDSNSNKEITTKSFDLKYGTSNVQINLNCLLFNNWQYTEFTLVNETTGETFNLGLEVEYYAGYEGGESWSEGSNSASKFISKVHEGKYHLVITPSKEMMGPPLNVQIDVIRDVFMTSNGVLLLLGFAIYPIIIYIRHNYRENKRWENSDYSPTYN